MSTTSNPIISNGGSIPFTGISQYASTFQSLLNTAVQTANIPITQLQNQDSTVLSKESALGSLQSAVGGLTGSMNSLATLASGQALSANSSDSAVVTASVTGATEPAAFTINAVTSLAAAASEVSTNFYASSGSTPVSSGGTMTLVAGANHYTFSLSANNLQTLAQQINTQNAGVTASILTTSSGDYLSVSANQTGATALALYDGSQPGGTDLLTSKNQGSDAVFQLNGINISQSGNTVNSVIPGVTLTLQGTSSSATTISLVSDPAQLSSALENFVTQYNSLQAALQAQEGRNGGALAGDGVVGQLQTLANQIASHTNPGGGIQSLAELGVTFNGDTGQLSFNQGTFSGLSQGQIQDAFQFLGSATTGFAAFATQLNGFSDPVAGLIQVEINGDKTTDGDLQSQMTTLQSQVSAMQRSLTAQLEAADAQQQELENQQSELGASMNGLNLVLYGRNTTAF